MGRADLLEKALMLGKIESERRRGWQRMRWLDGITLTQWTWVWASSGSWWWTGKPGVLQFMGSQKVGHDSETELNWLTVSVFFLCFIFFVSYRWCIWLTQIAKKFPLLCFSEFLLFHVSDTSSVVHTWRRWWEGRGNTCFFPPYWYQVVPESFVQNTILNGNKNKNKQMGPI